MNVEKMRHQLQRTDPRPLCPTVPGEYGPVQMPEPGVAYRDWLAIRGPFQLTPALKARLHAAMRHSH